MSTACTIDVAAPAATNYYFVTASNAYGAAPPASTTIYVIGGTAPGNCSISQSPNTAASPVSPGTNVTLTLACGSGGPVTACAWSLIGSTACMVNFVAPAATASVTGTASNSFGAAPPVGTTIFVTNKLATALSITDHTPNPSTAQPVLVTVSLSVVPPGIGTPTGSITVSWGSDSCGITLPAAPASCKISPSSVGTKNLVATYGGDANFAGSTSAAVSHTVNGTTQTPQLPTPGGSGSIGVTPPPGAPPGCALTSAEFIDQQEVPLPPPAGYSFPQGLANFAVGGCGSSVVTMTVTYDVAISPTAKYYKYGREQGNPTPHWYELTAAQNNLQINGNRVTFTLTDGGPGG
ncbi:MAG: Ig-like domain repeat protein [Betaproteobacteria bacterium]|nr:Ig-like domain repeat protein [Betaproteobacteria bacterium]